MAVAYEPWVSIAGLPPTRGVPIEDVSIGWGPPLEAKIIDVPAHSRIRRKDVPALIERVRSLGIDTSDLEVHILPGEGYHQRASASRHRLTFARFT